MQEKISAEEIESAQKYYDLKLEVKGVLRDAKDKITKAASTTTSNISESPAQQLRAKRPSVAETSAQLRAPETALEKGKTSSSPKDKTCTHSAIPDKPSVFPPARRSKYTWVSDDNECLTELTDAAVRAELSEECTGLLVFHSETLKYGKYAWTVTAQEDCCVRVGIVARQLAGEPYSFDPMDKEDGVHWSWYLESEETGATLCKSFNEDGDVQESNFYFGKKGDVLKIVLTCIKNV